MRCVHCKRLTRQGGEQKIDLPVILINMDDLMLRWLTREGRLVCSRNKRKKDNEWPGQYDPLWESRWGEEGRKGDTGEPYERALSG
jgi:hypothetical protein